MTKRHGTWLALVLAICALTVTAVQTQRPAPLLGPPAVFEGELDVLYEDSDSRSRLLYFLNAAGRRLPIRFERDAPDLHAGARVRLHGNLADDGTVTTTAVTTLATSPARTLGDLQVLVILFNFADNMAQPYSAADVATVNAQVRDFYWENSYQQTELFFSVTGWHTIPAGSATCDYSNWSAQADAAANAAGFDVAAYARRVYAFPQTSACAWWGMGSVGGDRSWVNGGYQLRVVAHEQGHNFGNRHSHARKCDAAGCIGVDYGDDRDVLGAGGVIGHMNAFQKERLGWLNYGSSPALQHVTTSADYWIDGYESLGGTKGLKIWNGAAGTYYYIEAREPVGFDTGVLPGVTLHSGALNNSDSSYQIDLAPLTAAWDSTLDVDQVFRDDLVGVSVSAMSAGTGGALVRVTFDAPTCEPTAPLVALAPAARTGSPGTDLDYTVTITNTNSAGCAPSPFAVSTALPTGWSSSFSPASTVVLSPDESASINLAVTSPATASGTHALNIIVADGTSALATTVVATADIAALSATASAVASKSSRNTRVITTTVTVANGGAGVAGATVAITITSPAGVKAQLAATTDSNGVAVAVHSLKPKDPSGAYAIGAAVTSAGNTATASTSVFVP